MDKCEIIKRLKNIAEHAVYTVGEEPFVMSLDDGIAVHEAIELLKKSETNCSEIPNNSDTISRQAAIDAFEMNCYPIRYDHNSIEKGMTITGIKQVLDELSPAQTELMMLPSAQPELDIRTDGTLHISVSKGQLDKIGRVLVEENGSIFCKQFYQDAEPERKTGHWIPSDSELEIKCNKCGKDFSEYVDSIDYIYLAEYPKFCPNCGAVMKEGEQE